MASNTNILILNQELRSQLHSFATKTRIDTFIKLFPTAIMVLLLSSSHNRKQNSKFRYAGTIVLALIFYLTFKNILRHFYLYH